MTLSIVCPCALYVVIAYAGTKGNSILLTLKITGFFNKFLSESDKIFFEEIVKFPCANGIGINFGARPSNTPLILHVGISIIAHNGFLINIVVSFGKMINLYRTSAKTYYCNFT